MSRRSAPRNCVHCGNLIPFATNQSYKKTFCNHHCSTQHRICRVSLTCEQCGTTYERRRDRANQSRFCSAVCKQLSQRKRIVKVCPQCNKSFTDTAVHSEARRFCSRQCLGLSQRNRIAFPCAVCGTPITKRPSEPRFLCSTACRTVAMTKRVPVTCISCGKVTERHLYCAHESFFCTRACFNKHRGENGIESRVRMALIELGIEFIQEYPVKPYFIDFFLPATSTALEIDGHYHTPEKDARRDAYLLERGIRTVRVKSRILRHKDIKPALRAHLNLSVD